MDFQLAHFYPDLMSLYGGWANLAVVKRHLEDLGNRVTVLSLRPGDEADLSDLDFIYMGAGTERSAAAALADFRRFGEGLRAAAEGDVPMLFAGTAMSLIGKTVTDALGNTAEGIGLGDFSSRETSRRIVGDVYGATGLYNGPVVGFMNKCTLVSGVKTPLLTTLSLGSGNQEKPGANDAGGESDADGEGFLRNHVIASHLTGPILVKNPPLLNWVLGGIYARRGQTLPEGPAYPYEAEGYEITVRELKNRIPK
ncbi:MAG: hypothetical protein RR350_03825 [Oscillibacter sp.]